MHKQSPGNEDDHYAGEYQPMDFGADFDTPMYQINKVLKYLVRHPKKGRELDLKKAIFFIENLRGRTFGRRVLVQRMKAPIGRVFPEELAKERKAVIDLIDVCDGDEFAAPWRRFRYVIDDIKAIALDKYGVEI